MIAGDTVAKVIYLQTLSGRGLSYANKTAFQADGWDIDWVDTDGDNLSSQPTWTIEPASNWTIRNGAHIVEHTVPSGVGVALATVPGWAQDPGSWSTEGQSYDEDSLAGLFLTAQGVPGVQSAADGDLGDVVMGDSWHSGTLTVPLGKISGFGYSDLSGMTISAAFKRNPSDTPVNTGVTAAIADASARTVTVSWTTFPTGMNLGSDADDLSETWYLDIQLKHTVSGRILTVLRYQLRVVWQRDTTT